MKKILLYILITISGVSYSQELSLPVFTQYLADNEFVVSPTFAGIGDNLRIRANGLTQWVGIKGAPDNQALFADMRISDRSGIGVSMYNDKNGNTRQQGIKFSFAHHLTLDEPTAQYLSFGLSFNINSFRIDIENFVPTPDIPIVDPNIIDDRAQTNNNFDVGFLYRFKGFYLSFNANNLLEKDVNPFTGVEPNSLLNFQLYSGLVLSNPNNRKVQYEPSVFYQRFNSDGRSSTDVNFKYRKYTQFEDYYWVGLSYRFLNDQFFQPLNIGPMAGIMQNGFYFAYSYQFTVNELAAYNSGTHMITLGIDILQGASNCGCTTGNRKYWKYQ
jgi:type IX secretion system PorP/SprF family membrane protein